STRRSVTTVGDGTLAKLRRTVIEASRQCRRNRLMEIAEPLDWNDFLVWSGARTGSVIRWVAHPGTEPVPLTVSVEKSDEVVALIGPEGGFTDEEIDQARATGFRDVSIGPTILRIETAALTLAAVHAVTVHSATPPGT
ncbi:MAG: RsmE family RNA methyltransferase, partial [Planctomycetia bacterium]|nr:RsmE family RNA methyltransferase [Planctomycetia bacterium]